MNELNSILNPMRQILRSRPLILKNFFKKEDTNNMRAVTITQFMSVLKSVGLLGDNVDDTVRVLRAAYPAKHPEKYATRRSAGMSIINIIHYKNYSLTRTCNTIMQ